MKKLIENWRRFITESEKIALGQCYPFANRMATKWSNDHVGDDGKVHPDIDDKDKFKVVHGKVTDKFSGESYNHAWVEMGDLVFDDQTKHTKPDGIPKKAYYELFQPEVHAEYNAEESMINCMKSGHEGPWHGEKQEEGRDFQKDSSYIKDHANNKEELIGDGGQDNSEPYDKEPIKKRSKSAPPA